VSTRQQCECAGGNEDARPAGVSQLLMGAIARYEEQVRDQIGSIAVVGTAHNGGVKVGWLWW
jgi:hypothetical protein